MYKQMQYFITVVDEHSFTKAAEKCFISQSAISQQIKTLEDDLGVKLLIRKKKSFTLTPAGEYFYKQSQEILNTVENTCIKTKEIFDDENVLKIGYLRGYNGQDVKDAILEFSSLYPEVTIDIKRGNHEELYNALVSHDITLAISDQRRAFSESYVNCHLLNMNCYIEVSKQNSISHKDDVDVKELRDMTCILVATKDQQDIEREFYENIIGLKCRYIFVEGIEEAKLLVSINKGFMVVEQANLAKYQNESINQIPLYKDEQQVQRNYCAFWKKNITNYYIEEFVDILKEKINIEL